FAERSAPSATVSNAKALSRFILFGGATAAFVAFVVTAWPYSPQASVTTGMNIRTQHAADAAEQSLQEQLETATSEIRSLRRSTQRPPWYEDSKMLTYQNP